MIEAARALAKGGRGVVAARVEVVVIVAVDLSCSLTRAGPETMAQVVRRPEEREKVVCTATCRLEQCPDSPGRRPRGGAPG